MENTITSELQLQAHCYLWFHNNLPKHRGCFRRVRNETDVKGRAGMILGQQNKATGIIAGTWDSFFVIDPIVWIEFKFGRGTLSQAQREFQAIGEEAGWNFHVIKSLETFKLVANGYFSK